MKKILAIIILLNLQSCSNTKTVLICGDHICVNKTEAKQYFEENLTIEVKVIDKKENKKIDLVELNMSQKSNQRKISINSKEITSKEVKLLSKKERMSIKKKVFEKEKSKKTKNILIKKKDNSKKVIDSEISKINNKIKKIDKNVTKNNNVVDVCQIIDSCNIDEISKFLIKEGKKKRFPDITSK